MAAKREAVAAALYQTVRAGAGKVVGLKTSSRTLRAFDQVDIEEMPALFQHQKPETVERPGQLAMRKVTMHFELWLMVAPAPSDLSDLPPSAELNVAVDAIEEALAPSPVTLKNTLGNICEHCWIEGAVEYYEGLTKDGKSIAIVPVAVLVP